MTEQLVPTVRTTFSTEDFARALIAAWRAIYVMLEQADDACVTPSKASCGVVWAQYALETGRGKSCWCNNIGNVKHVAGDGHDYCMLTGVWEIIGGKKVVFNPPDPQTWFRAYPSLADGMREHLEFLRKRYAAAWAEVERGDARAFVHALKTRGYFTGDEGVYTKNVVSLQAEFGRSGAYEAAIEALPAAS
ncbi:MAG: hypothetical protein FWD73_16630 [Polyangiaceae bacterium]|nr:hypothetical protein [Polyangiaceae bacterium]